MTSRYEVIIVRIYLLAGAAMSCQQSRIVTLDHIKVNSYNTSFVKIKVNPEYFISSKTFYSLVGHLKIFGKVQPSVHQNILDITKSKIRIEPNSRISMPHKATIRMINLDRKLIKLNSDPYLLALVTSKSENSWQMEYDKQSVKFKVNRVLSRKYLS